MAPGYFQDLVVPLNEPKQLQHELITEEIRIVTGKLAKSNRLFPEEAPKDSLFKEVQPNIEPNYGSYFPEVCIIEHSIDWILQFQRKSNPNQAWLRAVSCLGAKKIWLSWLILLEEFQHN